MNYYNDNDKFCCQWLRNLIEAKLIPQGVVDDRSISDIRPSELREFRQLHFFAGIGGWAYALRLAGWPDDRPVITGSCPCQPFSVAGKGKGVSDERHLWPAFRWLIAHLRPATVFGEQVASKAGRLWLAGVRVDLEELGYAVGAADLCAAGVSAPHIRQRLFWVADAQGIRRGEGRSHTGGRCRGSSQEQGAKRECCSDDGGLGNSKLSGLERRIGGELPKRTEQRASWSSSSFIPCADGKARRIPAERELFPLAHGSANRVGALRGAGNSIVPQAAAEFISSFMETDL